MVIGLELIPDLRVLELCDMDDDSVDSPQSKNAPFARGPGGTNIREVINLWRGSWSISKGANDVDWGVGSGSRLGVVLTADYQDKIVTATPSGQWMIFDANRGKLGWCFVSIANSRS